MQEKSMNTYSDGYKCGILMQEKSMNTYSDGYKMWQTYAGEIYEYLQ